MREYTLGRVFFRLIISKSYLGINNLTLKNRYIEKISKKLQIRVFRSIQKFWTRAKFLPSQAVLPTPANQAKRKILDQITLPIPLICKILYANYYVNLQHFCKLFR